MNGAELAELDVAVERALETGDESGLDVLGYGEISCVVAWCGYACKRLPLFVDQFRVDSYRHVFDVYLRRLDELGITPVPSELRALDRADGRIAVYCLQPVQPPDRLAQTVLSEVDEDVAHTLFQGVLDAVCNAVGSRLGLDAQLSNWVVTDDGLAYLDVTTPMMRDGEGGELLDTDLFLASLPWAMRGVVRRFLLSGILDKYYQPRGAILDFLGNLHKERLTRFVDAFIEQANPRFDEPITADEVADYYRADARTWAMLQRLRRIDRGWQRRVRHRQYPFLLPGKISR